MQIDHDFIAHVALASKLRGEVAKTEFHDLEFGLALPRQRSGAHAPGDDEADQDDNKDDPQNKTAANVWLGRATMLRLDQMFPMLKDGR